MILNNDLTIVSPDAGRCSSVHVSVRNLPRVTEIPNAICAHHLVSPSGSTAQGVAPSGGGSGGGGSSSEESEEGKLSMAGALSWKEMSG